MVFSQRSGVFCPEDTKIARILFHVNFVLVLFMQTQVPADLCLKVPLVTGIPLNTYIVLVCLVFNKRLAELSLKVTLVAGEYFVKFLQ